MVDFAHEGIAAALRTYVAKLGELGFLRLACRASSWRVRGISCAAATWAVGHGLRAAGARLAPDARRLAGLASSGVGQGRVPSGISTGQPTMTRQVQHPSSSGRSAGSDKELTTNERLAWEMSLLITAEFVFALIMLSLECVILANPGGPFGKGHLYEPMFIGLLTFLSLLARFACSVLWCWWSIRIQSAIRGAGSAPLKRAPPWSVVWWFVPGFNFVMPYLSVRELWKNAVAISERRIDEWSGVRVPMFLHVWWGSWTIHLLAYTWAIALMSSAPAKPALESTIAVTCLVRDLALLVAAPLAIFLIIQFSRVIRDPDLDRLG